MPCTHNNNAIPQQQQRECANTETAISRILVNASKVLEMDHDTESMCMLGDSLEDDQKYNCMAAVSDKRQPQLRLVAPQDSACSYVVHGCLVSRETDVG